MKINENEEKLIMTARSNKLSGRQISTLYNIDRRKIQAVLYKNNIIPNTGRCPKYICDDNFFEKIDTEEKAYFLGFICADGCNVEKFGYVKIELQERDKKILEKLTAVLKTDRPLKIRDRSKENMNGYKCQNTALFSIYSRKICSDLIKLGCVPAKSLILKFPPKNSIPDNLFHHFIRGYFDGDGCFYCSYKHKNILKPMSNITSSPNFCQDFKIFIENKLNIHIGILKPKNNNCNCARITGKKNVIKFMEYIYKEATIYLERKRNKYNEFIKYYLKYYNLTSLPS